jgi:hypothetical protein
MSKLRFSSLLLAILVAAPAVLAGQLVQMGDYTRASQVAMLEMLVIALASVISSQRSLD